MWNHFSGTFCGEDSPRSASPIRPLPLQLALFAALCLFISSSNAQTQFEEEFDDAEKPWQEIAVQLPAPPKAENLLMFYVSPTATQTFAVDAKSFSVGSDGVIRYTLVATSNSGATTISYEGIRCETFERKLYAFGQPDGSWSRSRRDQWERISRNGANQAHAALAKGYFCQELTMAGKPEDMLARLRNQRPMDIESNR